MRIQALVASLLWLPLAAVAADDAINTDRPDFVESSNVVGKGRFQIETSVAVERDQNDGIKQRTTSTPSLLRYGINDTMELRLETDGRMRAVTTDLASGARQTDTGYADVSLGVKWHLVDAAGAAPSIGVLAHVDLDSGSAPFRAQGKGGSLRLAADWDLPEDMSLGAMVGLAWLPNDGGERYTSGIFGVVLGKEWNDKLRTFVEYSAPQIAHGRDGGTSGSLDIGGAYLLSNNVQVDTALSRGLNRWTPDWTWTAGLSVRF